LFYAVAEVIFMYNYSVKGWQKQIMCINFVIKCLLLMS